MSGKESKMRPLSVPQTEFDRQWDLIFGGKNMKIEISQHCSKNKEREAKVVKTEEGYLVELYEKNRYTRTVELKEHSLDYAENTAENWALGVLN